MIPPSVIGVFQYLSATLGVNGNNIALQILLEIEGIKDVGGVTARSVLHTDGRSRFIVQVDQKIIAPCLADDLGAV